MFGQKKNRILRVKNETVGSGYTIGGGITSWSDDDPSTIARQVELATNYGIGAFLLMRTRAQTEEYRLLNCKNRWIRLHGFVIVQALSLQRCVQ